MAHVVPEVVAPLVEREQARPQHLTPYRRLQPTYRQACVPDAEMQRYKIEALRYKWGGYRHGFRAIQWLHDLYVRLTV